MKEKKKSAVSWILTWAGQKRIAYVWSVLLAIGNVIFKILPYFIIADVVKLFLNGEKEFEIYLAKAVLIALSFIIAELLHSLSTALSHRATFAVLANIRKDIKSIFHIGHNLSFVKFHSVLFLQSAIFSWIHISRIRHRSVAG